MEFGKCFTRYRIHPGSGEPSEVAGFFVKEKGTALAQGESFPEFGSQGTGIGVVKLGDDDFDVVFRIAFETFESFRRQKLAVTAQEFVTFGDSPNG